MPGSIRSRTRVHNWSLDNIETRDLLERLEIAKALCHVPLPELSEILTVFDAATRERIISLVTAICKKKQTEPEEA